MNRLAVVGGSGFLGRQLISRCDDWSVTNLDRVPYGTELPSHVRELVADATDPDALREAFQDAQAVWIRAGILGGAVSTSMMKADEYIAVNTDLVRIVLSLCDETDVKRVFFDSSEQVWGTSGDLRPQRADDEPCASNFYGASKLIAEKILRLWAFSAADRSVQIFRYSRVRTALTRDVIYHMASAALQGKPIRIVGNPSHRVSFVHLDDAIEANLAALQLLPRFAIYQISTDRPYSLLELARLTRDLANADVSLQFDSAPSPDLPFEPFVVGMEWEKSARHLGVAPRWSLAAMIQETLARLQQPA